MARCMNSLGTPRIPIGGNRGDRCILAERLKYHKRNNLEGLAKILKALVMAGGKGTRLKSLKSFKEKPLININGKPMIQHVIECLEKVDRVKEIIVATSVHTPKTTEYIKKEDIE